MVGILKARDYVFNLNTFYVVGDDEAIDDNGEIAFLIRIITITSGGLDLTVFVIRGTG